MENLFPPLSCERVNACRCAASWLMAGVRGEALLGAGGAGCQPEPPGGPGGQGSGPESEPRLPGAGAGPTGPGAPAAGPGPEGAAETTRKGLAVRRALRGAFSTSWALFSQREISSTYKHAIND